MSHLLPLQQRSAFIALFVLCVLSFCVADSPSPSLIYHGERVNEGQWWRLFSAHLTHGSAYHLLLNLSGLTLLGILFGNTLSGWRWGLFFVLCALLITLVYWLAYPADTTYFGLSAVLYGLTAFIALQHWSQHRGAALLVFVAVLGWALWQWLVGPNPALSEQIGARVATESHVFGVGAGTLLWVLFRTIKQ